MRVYVDTSVLLRYVLQQQPVIAHPGSWQMACSSELCGVEARRTFDRLRLAQSLDDAQVAQAHEAWSQVEESLDIIVLTRAILQRAAMPMPVSVKTLDALHLATALVYREHREAELVFATHDVQQAQAARALGFKIVERP